MSSDSGQNQRSFQNVNLLVLASLGLIGVLTIAGVGFWYWQKQLRQLRIERLAAEEQLKRQELVASRMIEADHNDFPPFPDNEADLPNPRRPLTVDKFAEVLSDANQWRESAKQSANLGQYLTAQTQFREAECVVDRAARHKVARPEVREAQFLNWLEHAEFSAGLSPRRPVSFEERLLAQTLIHQAAALLSKLPETTPLDEYLLRIRQVESIIGVEIAPPPRPLQ